MGDLSEYRGIIVAVSFVSLAVILVTLMVAQSPALFTSASQGTTAVGEGSVVNNPNDLLAWNESLTLTLGPGGLPKNVTYFQVAGWNAYIQCYDTTYFGENRMEMATYDAWWIFKWNFQEFRWYKDSEEVSTYDSPYYFLALPTLNSDYTAEGMNGLQYQAKNSLTTFTVSFAFNDTTYASPNAAFAGNELYAHFNVDFSDRNTSINVIALLGGIFTFSLPGFDPTMQLVIMIPIYAAFAYIIFIVVLRVIGAVFGGGGA